MVHIKKIKTIHGLRYAVVQPYTSYKKVGKNEYVAVTKDYAVEYQNGNKYGDKISVAIFPVTPQGLELAKEVQKAYKNKEQK